MHRDYRRLATALFMEIQAVHTGKRHQNPYQPFREPVHSLQTAPSVTLDVPQGNRYVLKIEAHATLKQARPFAAQSPTDARAA